jgi:hypothetical protein
MKETNGSPSEKTQQSTKTRTPNEVQEEGDERNVDALLRTPKNFRSYILMFSECSIGSGKRYRRIYQENAQKRMQ